MKQVSIKSPLSEAQWEKAWTAHVVNASTLAKDGYTGRDVFAGEKKGRKLKLYYHQAYKSDRMVTCFTGTITPEKGGCLITGKIDKRIEAVIFLWFATIMMIAVGMLFFVQGNRQQGGMLIFIGIICLYAVKKNPDDAQERLIKELTRLSTPEKIK